MDLKKVSIWLIITFLVCLLYSPVVASAAKISEGSSVAGVELEGQSLEEAQQILEEKVEQWKNGPSLIATNDFETIEIPRDLFIFDLDTTFQQLEEKMQRHWSNFFMKQKNVKQELIVEVSSGAIDMIDFPEYVDVEQTLSYATQQAKHLTAQSITLTYMEDRNVEQEEIAAITLKIPNLSIPTIEYAVEVLDGQLIEPEALFSFLEVVVLPSEVADSEEEFSFLASGLYTLALQTNLEILERHARNTPAIYLEAGLEAVVDREKERDLKLYHTNNYSFTIEAELNGGEVELALTATNADLDYSYSIENVREVDYRTIYRYNPQLNPGAENILQEGKTGEHLEVYRIDNAAEASKESMSRDFYPPTHQIIEASVGSELEPSELDETSTNDSEEQDETSSENEEMMKNLLDSKVQSILGNCEEESGLCEEIGETEEVVQLLSGKDFWELLIMLYVLGMFNEDENSTIIEEEQLTNEAFPAEFVEPKEELKTEIETEPEEDSSREEVQ